MRLHEQLGGPEPDNEVESLLAGWRSELEEGGDQPQPTHDHAGRPGLRWTWKDCPVCNDELPPWPSVTADGADDGLTCPDCDKLTSDGEYCGECISERCSYYTPDEGGLD